MSHLDESYVLSEYDHPTNYITNFRFFNSYKSFKLYSDDAAVVWERQRGRQRG